MPRSVVSQRINGLGLACLLLAAAGSIGLGIPPVLAAFLCVIAYALPIIILEVLLLKVHARPTTGLDWTRWGDATATDWSRIGTKLLGVATCLFAVAAVHWTIRLYSLESMAVFGQMVLMASVLIVPLTIAYVVAVDRVMVEPCDAYWHLGMAARGRFEAVEMGQLRHLAGTWLVKGFFLPIMAVYLVGTLGHLQADVSLLATGHVAAVRWLTDFVAVCELSIVCVGYSLTLRALDSHIRSVNPFLLGWLVTLACYEPFNHVVSGRILDYDDGRYWFDWLAGSPILSGLWAILLLASFCIWLWATSTFGLRWSNLTNRGIITNGPYRFTKHPDYLAKSIFFWLIHMPFLSTAGPLEAFRACLLLGLINLIYFYRARMEEKHLSADPAYRAYAIEMNRRSIFAPLAGWLPALRYAPATP